MNVTVYCASSSLVSDKYFEATRVLGNLLVDMDARVIFGGGGNGLMGCLADTVLARGGKIRGIIPGFMKEIEWAHPKVVDMQVVETMAERKHLLLEEADVIVSLPGGTGTLEELFEALTLKRLGRYLKPIIIINTGGYYDELRTLLEKAIDEKFMTHEHKDMYRFIDNPKELPTTLKAFPEWKESAIDFATLKREYL